MVGHGGSSASSYLADPTSPIPSHCASIVVTSTLRVNMFCSHPLCPGSPVSSPVHLLHGRELCPYHVSHTILTQWSNTDIISPWPKLNNHNNRELISLMEIMMHFVGVYAPECRNVAWLLWRHSCFLCQNKLQYKDFGYRVDKNLD